MFITAKKHAEQKKQVITGLKYMGNSNFCNAGSDCGTNSTS